MALDATLKSRELVTRVLRGQPVPRPAVGPLAVHYCARVAGVTLRQYTTDPRVLADCVVQYYQRFHPDAVWLSADTWVTAQAMGAAVAFVDEQQPLGGTGAPAILSRADLDRLPPPDPTSQGRWPLMLDALRRIRQALPDVFVVACLDQYPFSLACALLGLEQVMVRLVDDPALVLAAMERGLEYGTAYARALAAAGADMLSGGDSPAGLLGPELYRQFAWPFERRLVANLKAATDAFVSLHICGQATPILSELAATGADVVELDQQVDLAAACRTVGPRVGIWGNLDPVGVLARGTPEAVRRAAEAALHTAAAAGQSRFVLSSGCTLAIETPPENVEALVAAVGSV